MIVLRFLILQLLRQSVAFRITFPNALNSAKELSLSSHGRSEDKGELAREAAASSLAQKVAWSPRARGIPPPLGKRKGAAAGKGGAVGKGGKGDTGKGKSKRKGANMTKGKSRKVAAGGADGKASGDTLRVLTYNTCYGCAGADLNDKTGMKDDLKRECMKMSSETHNGKTIPACANNMGHALGQFSKAMGGYDLIAFQEIKSTLFESVVKSRLKGSYGVVSVGEMTSLYNNKKFKAPEVSVLGHGQNAWKRPLFLILVFDPQKLIFINVHNDQPFLPPPAPPKSPNKAWKNWGQDFERELMRTAFTLKRRMSYRVIIAGDFNDIYGDLPGKVKLPWLKSPLSLQAPLAPSCCSTTLSKPFQRPGDYIFDSWGSAKNKVPSGYPNGKAMSDHRPVEAVLKR